MTPANNVEDVINNLREECNAAVAAFKRDLQRVRSGRASTGLLEGLVAEYYGSKVPLNQLAQLSTPEARLILIQVYDAGAVQAIEKAIQGAGLGLNPSRDGNVLRVMVPPLTEESRKEIVRHLHKMAEDIRVSIRSHRRDANDLIKKLEKDSVVSKDDSKRALDRIQKQTDASIEEVDGLLKAKEAECLEV